MRNPKGSFYGDRTIKEQTSAKLQDIVEVGHHAAGTAGVLVLPANVHCIRAKHPGCNTPVDHTVAYRQRFAKALLVEPDDRLAAFLRETVADEALTVVTSTFEEASLREASFDLGLSATAFHWLDEELALAKVAKLLRPGGWWAMVWSVFGDQRRPDAFHEATNVLLNGLSSPSAWPGDMPFALDAEARLAAPRIRQN